MLYTGKYKTKYDKTDVNFIKTGVNSEMVCFFVGTCV